MVEFSVDYRFDRVRRRLQYFDGKYQPSRLKRLQCWLLDEKLYPIDWEGLEPYQDKDIGIDNSLVELPKGEFNPTEMVSQPDMISDTNIYVRRLVFAGVMYRFYLFMESNRFHFQNNMLLQHAFYNPKKYCSIAVYLWLYYIFSRMFITRDYILPFN